MGLELLVAHCLLEVAAAEEAEAEAAFRCWSYAVMLILALT